MSKLLFFMAACLLLVSSASALSAAGDHDSDPTGSLPGVADLTPSNFDQIVNGGKHAIVEFYAPWCGHCKRLTPEYQKLGALVEADPKLKNRVVIAKADADAHRSLGEKFDVKGFPTIKYLPRGKPATKENAEDYNGGRTAEAFLEFIKEKLAADSGFARVEALADIASKFLTSDNKAGLIAEAKTIAASLTGDDLTNSDLYFKLFAKIVEKGAEYAKTERARVEKLLASGSVHAAKVEEMAKKSSILGHLLAEE